MTHRELKQSDTTKSSEAGQQTEGHQERNVTLASAWLENTKEPSGGGSTKKIADIDNSSDRRAKKIADMVADHAQQGPLTEKLFFKLKAEFNQVLNTSKHLLDADRIRGFNRLVNEVNSRLAHRNSSYRFIEHSLKDGDMGSRLDLCSIRRDVNVDGIPFRQVVVSQDYVIKRAER